MKTLVLQQINTDGTIINHNKRMTLEEMQAAVGGDIQAVPSTTPGQMLVVNEDGLNLPDMQENFAARNRMHEAYRWPGVPLMGNALLVKESTL